MNNSILNISDISDNNPSICIPRVSIKYNKHFISSIFKPLKLGDIYRIDMISYYTKDNKSYNRVFIHFSHWYNNCNSIKTRLLLDNYKYIKVIYDKPWFWKCLKSRLPRPNLT